MVRECDGDEDRWREEVVERNRRKKMVVVAMMWRVDWGGGGGDVGGSDSNRVRSLGRRRWVLGNYVKLINK